jgi:hypothetical protein
VGTASAGAADTVERTSAAGEAERDSDLDAGVEVSASESLALQLA